MAQWWPHNPQRPVLSAIGNGLAVLVFTIVFGISVELGVVFIHDSIQATPVLSQLFGPGE